MERFVVSAFDSDVLLESYGRFAFEDFVDDASPTSNIGFRRDFFALQRMQTGRKHFRRHVLGSAAFPIENPRRQNLFYIFIFSGDCRHSQIDYDQSSGIADD